MHPTNIKQEVVYLCLHERIIEVGYEQNMELKEGGYVPFYMTSQEHVSTKSSHYDEPQLKDKIKAKLLGNFKGDDEDISVAKGERVGELQDIDHTN